MITFKHGSEPDSKFNLHQLTMGIQAELEHTNSKSIAKQIAKAHLLEDSKYYTHLKIMEKKYKR
jgi:hypothetical protein